MLELQSIEMQQLLQSTSKGLKTIKKSKSCKLWSKDEMLILNCVSMKSKLVPLSNLLFGDCSLTDL